MTGFPPQCGMELASWKENLDGIFTRVQNGGGQLEGKPRPDFCQIPERSWLVGQKNRTGFCPESGIELAGWREDPDQFSLESRMELTSWRESPDWISAWSPEWSWLVRGKTRTGFCLESGMELARWRENLDCISTWSPEWSPLRGKPRPDFCWTPEWSWPNPDQILPRVWNDVGLLEGKHGPDFCQSPEWSRLIGGKCHWKERCDLVL